jgi:hypothetical protein
MAAAVLELQLACTARCDPDGRVGVRLLSAWESVRSAALTALSRAADAPLQRLNSWGLVSRSGGACGQSRGYLAGSGGGSRGWNATLCDVGIEARRADHYEDLRLRAACDGEAVLGIAWQEHESPR